MNEKGRLSVRVGRWLLFGILAAAGAFLLLRGAEATPTRTQALEAYAFSH